MNSKIISLNVGESKVMNWNGRSVTSSMEKESVEGPLIVHSDRIEHNSFANPQFHGTIDSVLYAYGLSSAQKFVELLGLKKYVPGATGETVTLDHFDETQISIGDVFSFGEVIAQATYPRIPCGKVSFRMQHENGQKAMQECGLSGVYFRILTPGKIHKTDVVKRIKLAEHRLMISDLYRIVIYKLKPTAEQLKIAEANGSLPTGTLEKIAKYTN